MGVALGFTMGVGLLLVYWWFVSPRPPRRRTRTRRGRLESLLASAGVSRTSPAGIVALCLTCGLAAALSVQLISRTWPVSTAFGVLGAYLPVAVLHGRARRRMRELAEVWPEAVDNLASAVRAGLSLPEALCQLSVRGPEPLRPAFAQFELEYQVTGRFSEALEGLKDRLAEPVGDRVVEALRIAREVGGGELGPLLRSLSGHLRDDARTRAELESRQAWAVNGARLAVAAPWLVLLMLSFQQDVISRYASGAGIVVLALGGAACLLAYRLMVRIGRLPQERRVLS